MRRNLANFKGPKIWRLARQSNWDVWQLEVQREAASRLTVAPANDWFLVWSPDGSRLLFGSDLPLGLT